MSFCFAAERFCLTLSWKFTRFFPVLFVNSLLTWAIYALIWKLCFQHMEPGIYRSFTIITSICLYGLCTLTYIQILYLGGGSPLDLASFNASNLDLGLELNEMIPPSDVMNNVTAKDNGEMRFCNKCLCWKPDRAHHCRTCRRCILKMDHHCPWFGTCIGFNNHKIFVLFLIYADLFCLACFGHSFSYVYLYLVEDSRLYGDEDISLHLVILTILSGILSITLIIFTGYTIYGVLCNKTTIEALEDVRYKTAVPNSQYRYNEAPTLAAIGNVFDVGMERNWISVMGENPWLWFVPIPNSLGQGTSFEINQEVWDKIQNTGTREIDAVEQENKHRAWTMQQRMVGRGGGEGGERLERGRVG